MRTLAQSVAWLMELQTAAERLTPAEAAAARMRELSREQHERGYTRGGLVASLRRDFLQGLADGSA